MWWLPLSLGAAHLQLVAVEVLVAEARQIDSRPAPSAPGLRVSPLVLPGHVDLLGMRVG